MVLVTAVRDYINRMLQDISGMKVLILDYSTENASALRSQLDQQKGVVECLISNTKLLESKIQEAKSKKNTLKARGQSARTATKVSEMVGKVNISGALAAFEKMEEKGYL